MERTVVAVGVDNGGTWIRIKVLNSKGRVLGSVKKASPTVEQLPFFLKKHLKRFSPRLGALAVGSRGVWKQTKRRSLARALRGLAKQVVVMSDVEAAWLSAFKAEGIIVICGTGSIAYGRSANGVIARAGGLGPAKGDEGSGYWIGKEWLTRTHSKHRQKNITVRQIAALALGVLKRASQRDPLARLIVWEAQRELAILVKDLAKRLRFKRVPISVAGSILENPAFRKGFLRALAPLPVTLKMPRTDSATALARSIMSHDAH